MTYLAIIRRTLAYALIASVFYHILPSLQWEQLQVVVLVAVFGCWLVDLFICLVSRVRQ